MHLYKLGTHFLKLALDEEGQQAIYDEFIRRLNPRAEELAATQRGRRGFSALSPKHMSKKQNQGLIRDLALQAHTLGQNKKFKPIPMGEMSEQDSDVLLQMGMGGMFGNPAQDFVQDMFVNQFVPKPGEKKDLSQIEKEVAPYVHERYRRDRSVAGSTMAPRERSAFLTLGDILHQSPHGKTKEFKKLEKQFLGNPDLRKALDSVIMGHELAEVQTPVSRDLDPHTYGTLKPSKFYGHSSPEVLFREHNMITTLPEKTRQPVTDFMKMLRNETGSKYDRVNSRGEKLLDESPLLNKIIPEFRYGEGPRLSRRQRTAYTDLVNKHVREAVPQIPEITNIQQAHARGFKAKPNYRGQGFADKEMPASIKAPSTDVPGLTPKAPTTSEPTGIMKIVKGIPAKIRGFLPRAAEGVK